MKDAKVADRIQETLLVNSDISQPLAFIVQDPTRKTIYGGALEFKQLLVIPSGAQKAEAYNLGYRPQCGAIFK